LLNGFFGMEQIRIRPMAMAALSSLGLPHVGALTLSSSYSDAARMSLKLTRMAGRV
jgi:hypothetical protein